MIWGLFVVQFIVELSVAPKRIAYIRKHWITGVALLIPAARLLTVFRALRALAALRGVRLVRVIAGANRSMRALGSMMSRRGLGYALSLSAAVALAGAAGMDTFERGVQGSTIHGFGSALWWTAMTLTTMGSDYFPRTPEGRLLCLLLAIYGFAVFGYITAIIASFFVARDADQDEGDVAGAKQMKRLEAEVARVHQRLDDIANALARR
ncbi:MAG TPA: potassium channel family protein [Gemmatimonadaceae bacterium]|nr:potassium channel family protein [Gemmatimonadaceae bacterium]